MLYEKKGDRFTADGKTFTVGGEVFANGNSEYMGLFGTVTEICTDEDRETDNDTPDIYCSFDPPEEEERAYAYERHFSELYRCPKKLEEIGLDCVIMSPEMLVPIPNTVPEKTGAVYTLSYCTDSDDSCSYGVLGVSSDVGALLRIMLDDLGTQVKEVVLSHTEESDGNFFFIYEAKETGAEDLYLSYMISLTDVFPNMEGGSAA